MEFGDYPLDKTGEGWESIPEGVGLTDGHIGLSIQRIYSGVPRERRRKRAVIVLQTYADDSGSDDNSEVYALSGYLLPATIWDVFSAEWDATCRAKRYRMKRQKKGLEYYSTNEALGLKDQFEGWTETERNARIVQLASVIADFNPIEVGASVRRSDYNDVFSSGFIGAAKSNPYFLLATYLCAQCVSEAERISERSGMKFEKVDIFFDNQGLVEPSFKQYFDNHLKLHFPLLGECFHVDDRDFVPLQAADMSAARIRRDNSTTALWSSADSILGGIRSVVKPLDRASIQQTATNAKIASGTSRRLSGITPKRDPSC